MSFPCLLCVLCVFCLSSVFSQNFRASLDDPSAFYSMIELICAEGYHVQEHTVTTEDGYILSIYRIPNGKKRPKIPRMKNQYQNIHKSYHSDFASCFKESLNESSSGPAVLLAHGLFAAADHWVLQGDGYDLGFLLADRGYDVWFSNIRGNFYSRRHKTLKPSDVAFWNFSFHENGVYDMAGTIDYILQFRGLKKLYYIGHSMGTTMFFTMAAFRPEYNDKIQLFVGLTPVGLLRREHFSLPRITVFNSVLSFVRALVKLGVYEILPRTYFPSFFSKALCAKNSPIQNICYDLGFSFSGYHSKLFLRNRLHMYLSHGLSGSSAKTFFHFEQLLDASYFQLYDYGPEGNVQNYGQPKPPEYDFKKVTAPVALYYSKGDNVAYIKDVIHLKESLPCIIEEREFAKLNHLDFLWAFNAKDLIYPKIMAVMERFKNQSTGSSIQ